MTDNKLTDERIIKAKAHFEYGINCDIFSEPVLSYAKTVLQAFEEIKRQKAEIERLRPYKRRALKMLYKHTEEVKSEARKEFAERLKKKAFAMLDNNGSFKIVDVDDIDNLLKEMEGE